jgi:hypothetical protein
MPSSPVAGFALESRKDALGKWWGSGSQQLTQIAGGNFGWRHVRGCASYPSDDAELQMQSLGVEKNMRALNARNKWHGLRIL